MVVTLFFYEDVSYLSLPGFFPFPFPDLYVWKYLWFSIVFYKAKCIMHVLLCMLNTAGIV